MKLLTALTLSALLTGCYDPSSGSRSVFRGLGDSDDPPTARAPGTGPGYSRTPVSTPYSRGTPAPVQPGASLEGTLGNVHDFASSAVELRAEGSSVIQLDAVNVAAQWWVMSRFTFSRPLSDPAWVVGRVYTFEPGRTSSDGLSVSALSCSGPTRGRYTFDSTSSRITVHVQEGSTPGARLVSFAQYWDTGAHVVTGTFEYLPR